MININLAIENFPKQQAIFDDPHRFKIVAKGRRFGLTKGAANDFMACALAGKFKKGLWVDVVNANIEKYIERYFIPELKKLPQHLWHWRKQQKILEIAEAYIDFRSAEHPENMEGFGYDKAFLNEAGIILTDDYLWDYAIKPMFWDYDCQVVIGGTPKGRGGIFEKLYQLGLDEDQKKYQSFHFSSFDSPFKKIHKRILEDIESESMPEKVIKQEVYAEFLEDTGVVFRGFMDIATAEPKEPHPDHTYVIGCDLAKVQDYTVLAVYDAGNNHQVYQARWNKLDWGMQKARIAETSRHFNGARIIIDETGLGAPIVEELARMEVPVEPFHFTNDSKRQVIEKLSAWIQTKKIRIWKPEYAPETIKELSQFTYDISEKTAKVTYSAPIGLHDDCVIAHALAVWGLNPLYSRESDQEPSIIQGEFQKRLARSRYQESEDADADEWAAI